MILLKYYNTFCFYCVIKMSLSTVKMLLFKRLQKNRVFCACRLFLFHNSSFYAKQIIYITIFCRFYVNFTLLSYFYAFYAHFSGKIFTFTWCSNKFLSVKRLIDYCSGIFLLLAKYFNIITILKDEKHFFTWHSTSLKDN